MTDFERLALFLSGTGVAMVLVILASLLLTGCSLVCEDGKECDIPLIEFSIPIPPDWIV